MSIERYRESLPDFSKDIRLNLSSVLTPEGAPGLTANQILGSALACAYAAKDAELAQALLEDPASSILTAAEIEAASLAATLMAMNNVYYRSIHLMDQQSLKTLPARLRMNGIAKPGIDRKDFEIYCLAVSALNGCGMCLNAHEKELQKAEVSAEGVQSALRIAAVIHGASQANFIRRSMDTNQRAFAS